MDFMKQQSAPPYLHWWDHSEEGGKLQVPWRTHHRYTEMDHPRWQCDEAGAKQSLFNLRRLKKFGLSPKTLKNLYRCTIESILSACITIWYGNCTTRNHKALQKVVRSAQHINGGKLPDLQDTYFTAQEGNQPPKPLPVHPSIIQKARSLQVHQSWDRETEKQLLSQDHQTVKQPSLT